ncbi:hypothetical protein ACFYZ2_12775 [Streptomyces sviceus]|uniref:hypothetical protein n=1 Tax=Streptomyces sviceus TaxID=285530 RepID=UPI003693B41C
MSVEVHLDQGRLSRFLRLRGGIVERNLARRTSRVTDIARGLAPGSMPQYIDWHIEEGAGGLQGVITCDHPATLYLLEGTHPHLIKARRGKACGSKSTGRSCSRGSCGIRARGRTTS